MKRAFLLIMAGGITLLSACSKDSGNNSSKGKTAKFTISAPGFNPAEGDEVVMTFTGGSGSGGTTTAWKINGVTQDNQINVRVTNDLLAGNKTVTVETATPLEVMTMVIGGVNIGAPYTINFKAVVNGQEKNNMSESVVETLSKNFTY